jgi:transcriptional regulator with XRE-family HTH domain
MRITHFTGKNTNAQDALRVTQYERTIPPMGIGKKIKQFREARRLTLAEVEARAGLSDGNLSRIERGKQWITEEKLAALADVLGVRTYEFFLDDNLTSSIEPVALPPSNAHLDTEAKEWLELRKYLGSDDIAEFKSLIVARQERNIRLLAELKGTTYKPPTIIPAETWIESGSNVKKQSSQSS